MIDQRTRDLINAAIDDELDEPEREELESTLEQSDAVRKFQSDMQALDSMLRALPDEQPPESLLSSVVEKVTLPQPPAAKTSTRVISPLFRYGLAASLGLLVGAGFFGLRNDPAMNADYSHMAGTMAPSSGFAGHTFNNQDVRGRINVTREHPHTILQVEIDSSNEVAMLIGFGESGYRFDGLRRVANNPVRINVTDDSIQSWGNGLQRFEVLLQMSDNNKQTGEIQLALSRDGETVEKGTLTVSQ